METKRNCGSDSTDYETPKAVPAIPPRPVLASTRHRHDKTRHRHNNDKDPKSFHV
jgi:hypothetical protein